ncbi:PEP-CTERM sorting domain-containing protein [Aeoliella sp.]|uniref:PEP-CTERM sorting domain-containing protein n=1 Tax=Aeoliella sp. TaxID=2795800 RepID=UPI003CCB90E7
MSAHSHRRRSAHLLLLTATCCFYALCGMQKASAVLVLHFDPSDTRTTFQNGYEDNRYGTVPALTPGDAVGWIMDTRVPSTPTPDPDNGPDGFIDAQQGANPLALGIHPTVGNVVEFTESNGNLLTFEGESNNLTDGWNANMDTNLATVLLAGKVDGSGSGTNYLFDFRDDDPVGGGSNVTDGLALRYNHNTGELEGVVKQSVVTSVPLGTGEWFTASLVWDGPNTTATISVETLAGVASNTGTASDMAMNIDRSRWGAQSDGSDAFAGLMGDYMVYNDVDDHSATFAALSADYLVPLPELTINRNTGEISITVPSGGVALTNVVGYEITSESETLDPTTWTSIADNYDAGSPGPNQVDPDNNWTKLSDPALRTDLSEIEFEQNGGAANGADFMPGTSTSLGNAWIRYYEEDVLANIVFDDGTVMPLDVVFTGNGGVPLTFGDLDFDGDVDIDDFNNEFVPNYGSDTSALIAGPEKYGQGDLNLDGTINIQDFIILNNAYAAANPGAAALSFSALSVPEPTTSAMLLMGAGALVFCRVRRQSFHGLATCAKLCGIFVALTAITARADLVVHMDPNVLESQFEDGGTGGGSDPAEIGDTVGFISDVRASLYGAAGAGDGFVDLEGSSGDLASRPQIVPHPTLGTVWSTTGGQRMLGRTGPSNNTDGIETNFDTNTISAIVAGQISSQGSGNGYFFDFRDDSGDLVDGFALRYNYSNGMLEGLAKQSVNAAVSIPLDEWFIASYSWDGPNSTATVSVETLSGEVLSNTAAAESAALDPDRWRPVANGNGSAGSRLYGLMGDFLLYNDLDDHSDVSDALADDYLLTVDVAINRTNGAATLTNNSGVDFTIDAYTITSAMGSIASGSYNSLDGQDYDGGAWTQLDTDPTLVSEGAFSLAGSTIANGASIPLGTLFNTSVGEEDLQFAMHLYGEAETAFMSGRVTYFDGPGGLAGDFNGDNVVNLADYTVWRNNLGADESVLPAGSGDGSGTVDAGDYTQWKDNFGATAGALSTVETAAVPEPSSLAIVALSMFGVVLWKSGRVRQFGKLAAAMVLPLVVASVASATTNDRLYLFGDADSYDASQITVSEGLTMGYAGANTFTADDAYVGVGSGQDLIVAGPTYTSVSDRPGADGTDFGANFDGASSLTTPQSLHLPHTFWRDPDFFNSMSPAYFPLNYNTINAHGIQLWAQPDQTALAAGNRQDVVIDTTENGIFISDEGNWGLQFDGGGESDVAVADTLDSNGWVHVMQISGTGDLVGGHSPLAAIMYVNGIAVKATDDLPELNNDGLSIGSNQAGDGNFYTGVLDDVAMFLWGDNSSQLGEDNAVGGTNGVGGFNADGDDWGAFSLLEDNEFIAMAIADLGIGALDDGDVNLDGDVDMDDIAALQSHWGNANLVDGFPTGDWMTRQQGDLNLDGLTNVLDAVVLRDELLAAGFSNITLDAIVGGTNVPEPNSLFIVMAGVTLGLVTFQRSKVAVRSRKA